MLQEHSHCLALSMKRRNVEPRVSVAMALQFRVDVDAAVRHEVVDDRGAAVRARERERSDHFLPGGTSDEPLDVINASQACRAFEIERRAAVRQISAASGWPLARQPCTSRPS